MGFVLQQTSSLPDVCSVHGRPAVARRAKDIRFRRRRGIPFGQSDSHWQQRTAGAELRELLTGLGIVLGTLRMSRARGTLGSRPDGVLEGDWPVCARCLRISLAFRLLGHALVAAGFVLVYAIFVIVSASDRRPIALGIALFPGWLPCGLIVAYLCYVRAGTFVRIGPINDPATVFLRAHPAFATAFERGDAPREHRIGWYVRLTVGPSVPMAAHRCAGPPECCSVYGQAVGSRRA